MRKYQESYPIDIIRYISKYRSITFIEEKNYSDNYTDNDYSLTAEGTQLPSDAQTLNAQNLNFAKEMFR